MVNITKEKTQELIGLYGFKKLTDVQKACLEAAAKNRDIVAISSTGTGKTHAFLLPIAEKVDFNIDRTQVVISSPTRELALQLYDVFKLIKEVYKKARIKLLTGGSDNKRVKESLKREPQIVIGTPGRLRDLYESGDLRVDHTEIFVIDEADMTLEFGFLEDIDKIFAKMVRHPEVMCFSATLPEGLRPFIKKYLEDPDIIEVKTNEGFDPDIEHIMISCRHMSYEDALVSILGGFKPYTCIIFANDRNTCEKTFEKLRSLGLSVGMLHGGLEQRQRKRIMKAIVHHDYTYLVATDIAARGLDIDGVTHVVSLGLPSDLSFYVHRSGRTGRSGKKGTCFLLYRDEDLNGIASLKQKGITFKAMSFKGGNWKDVKNRQKPKGKEEILEKEIAKTLHRKKEKVKPNYKKKKTQAIEKIKRKKRQEFIRQKIKEEKKARYKAQGKNR